MKYAIMIFLVFFICLPGCKEDMSYVSIINSEEFDNSSFQIQKNLSMELLNNDIVGSLARISCIDTLLYIIDSKLDSIVHVVNIKNNAYIGKLIPRGNGPGEMLSVGGVISSFDKKTIWMYDITQRQWLCFNLSDLRFNSHNNNEKKISFTGIDKFKSFIDNPIWISNSEFVCTDLYSFKNRFLIYNKDLELKVTAQNPQLKFDETIQSEILSDIFSSNIDVSPDYRHIVLAGRYFDIIEIYSSDGKLKKLIKGPSKGFDFKYDKDRSLQNGTLIKSSDSRRAFIRLKATHDKIYVLYSGRTKKDLEHYSYGRIIYVFDYDGNPLVNYQLDSLIADFDVDESMSTIYAIQYPELSIVKCRIN